MQEEDRVVVVRFGHDWDETCMQMDEVLLSRSPLSRDTAQRARCTAPMQMLPSLRSGLGAHSRVTPP